MLGFKGLDLRQQLARQRQAQHRPQPVGLDLDQALQQPALATGSQAMALHQKSGGAPFIEPEVAPHRGDPFDDPPPHKAVPIEDLHDVIHRFGGAGLFGRHRFAGDFHRRQDSPRYAVEPAGREPVDGRARERRAVLRRQDGDGGEFGVPLQAKVCQAQAQQLKAMVRRSRHDLGKTGQGGDRGPVGGRFRRGEDDHPVGHHDRI
jgi:hypothetical protein